MTAYPHDYGISLTSSIPNLHALATPISYPRSLPAPYSDVINLGDNSTRGIGAPIVIWHWDKINQTERDFLRTFCPGASAAVFIRTRMLETADSYANYSAVMVWPSMREERDATRRLDFDIEFRELVAV